MIFGIDIGVRSFAIFGMEEINEHYIVPKATRYLEIQDLCHKLKEQVLPDDQVFIEEPPHVANIRTAMALSQTVGALLASSSAPCYLIPVDSWKKAVVEHAGASKEWVSAYLAEHYPQLSARCQSNQNIVDAACLALYGSKLNATPYRATGTQ